MMYEKEEKEKQQILSFESHNDKIFFFSSSTYYTYVHLFLCDVTVNRLELSDYEHLHMCINYLFFCQIKTNFFVGC
jgi:hypothetical protein